MTRVAVFIDYQNMYMRAHEFFASPQGHFVDGQVYNGYASRLSLPGMWCHYLSRADYQRVADPTDYTREVRHPPLSNP